jgi:hypothetical protein
MSDIWAEMGRDSFMERSSVFWDIAPCSPLKVNRRFRGTCYLHLLLQGRKISEARNQNEIGSMRSWFVGFQRTIGWYIPEARSLHSHLCDNLESYILFEALKRNSHIEICIFGFSLGYAISLFYSIMYSKQGDSVSHKQNSHITRKL